MLKRISGRIAAADLVTEQGAAYPIGEASFPVPFPSQLEYNSPAHGTWNIVHIGMLVPESHQIYICTRNCNRGVVLTAAEMNAMDRFSTITVMEENLMDGDMEGLIVDGVTEILEKLPKKPRAVLLFPSCVHRFMGSDIPMVYRILRNRYPEILFIEGYMDCILQKGGITPDQRLRKAMYAGLTKAEDENAVNIIGNTLALDSDSELAELVRKAGAVVKELPACESFDAYQRMGNSRFNVSLLPIGRAPAQVLEQRLHIPHLHVPQCFGYEEIKSGLDALADALKTERVDHEAAVKRCEDAFAKTKEKLKQYVVAIDGTAVPRPLGLARQLISHGISVFRVYADAFVPEEKEDYDWLCMHAPELMVYATIHVKMRVLPRIYDKPVLAVGQKAAYFTGTKHFVNMVEGGGFHGYQGLCRLLMWMQEAAEEEKDTEDLIIRKGLGGESII